MTPEAVLSFWIGPLDADGLADEQRAQRWWARDSTFDAEIRARFEPTWHEIMSGSHEHWLVDARSRLAYVIVLDQFSRNMFRGQADAFAADARALAVARDGVAQAHDRELRGQERVFLYMPFMHSEDLAVQEECVRLFTVFQAESSGRLEEVLAQNTDFARRHRDVVARFGRFPHRNQVLSRPSTAEELAFLELPGSSF